MPHFNYVRAPLSTMPGLTDGRVNSYPSHPSRRAGVPDLGRSVPLAVPLLGKAYTIVLPVQTFGSTQSVVQTSLPS
jgi:hypothetical protein